VLTALGIVVFFVIPAALLAVALRWLQLEYRRDRVPILLYHRIISKSAAEQGAIPDEEMIWVCYDTVFARQMAYLHEAGYTTLDFDDYVKVRSGQAPLPPRPVIITLDDGYSSSYTYAYPALKKHGQKATVFVAPEPDEHTRRLVEGVDGFLNAAQMREMAEHGVAIQSHTLTHCILTVLDDETVLHELSESRRRLAEITGRPVDHLAVPRAGYSRRIKRLVKKTGYQTACCNNKGSANMRSDPLALPRIVIERDMSVEDFARCLMPRYALTLRIVGNIKRIPERIGGAGFARKVRDRLYGGPLRPLFEARNLKKLVAICGLVYLLAIALFTWRLVASR
jgi:peptidoglycan/xylan/chitin deacetylase (PgdA/CDA1 family)